MTEKGQRALIVRPKGEPPENHIAPIQKGESELEATQEKEEEATAEANGDEQK